MINRQVAAAEKAAGEAASVDIPAADVAGGEKLWADIEAMTAETADQKSVLAGMWTFMGETSLVPGWDVIGNVALGGLTLGWTIGNGIKGLFGVDSTEGGTDEAATYHAQNLTSLEPGADLDEVVAGAVCTPDGVTCLAADHKHPAAPGFAFGVNYNTVGQRVETNGVAPCASAIFDGTPPSANRVLVAEQEIGSGYCAGQTLNENVDIVGASVLAIGTDSGVNSGADTSKSSAAPASPADEASMKAAAVAAAMGGDLGAYQAFSANHSNMGDTGAGGDVLPADPADPRQVVPTPGDHETYSQYDGDVEAAGFKASNVPLDISAADPTKGPDEVVSVSPKSGTKQDPDTTVTVHHNPSTAGEGATDSWAPPAIPAIDFSPLAGIATSCDVFPFGAFCWVIDGLSSWGSSGTCPGFDVPFHSDQRDATAHLDIDTCGFDPAMDIIRPIFAILSAFGMAFLFARAAMGFGGESDD